MVAACDARRSAGRRRGGIALVHAEHLADGRPRGPDCPDARLDRRPGTDLGRGGAGHREARCVGRPGDPGRQAAERRDPRVAAFPGALVEDDTQFIHRRDRPRGARRPGDRRARDHVPVRHRAAGHADLAPPCERRDRMGRRSAAGSGDRDGSFTFVRSDPAGGSVSWAAGHYRIDLLAADQLYSIAVQVPGRFGSVPAPDEWAATRGQPRRSPRRATRRACRSVRSQQSMGSASRSRPDRQSSMSEEEAWRENIGGPQGMAGSTVATAYLPRATGLGVDADESRRRPPRDRPSHRSGSQVPRCAPMLGGISELRGRTPYVTFAPRRGGAWPAGVYAITVRWTDPAGLHAETWHVELRPGPGGTGTVR